MTDSGRSSGAVFLAAFLAVLSPACRGREAGPGLTRLIDDLTGADFVASPLRNLAAEFPRRSVSVAPEALTLIPEAGPDSPAVLAFKLDLPALHGGDPALPPLLEIRERGEKLAYALPRSLGAKEWAFLPGRRQEAVDQNLLPGERWSCELVLPAGPVSFSAIAPNPQPDDYLPHVLFILDGARFGEVVVAAQTRLTVTGEVTTGRHILEIGFDTGTNLSAVDERGAYLRLARLEVESATDLLVLAASGRTAGSPSGEIALSYAPDPRRPAAGEARDEALADRASLYDLATDAALSLIDAGVTDPSSPFKRKIHWRGAVRNVVLAPPLTEFRRRLRPAKGSFLEFGCGILASPDASGVRFKVSAAAGNDRVELFTGLVVPGGDLLEA